ncbi:MAG: DEAD/DEAH box helicase [Actinomycetia bacterium]|nr:DEAD/DEAH box helicase [Actinomycetes bacterium]
MDPADLQRRHDELLAENARLKRLLKLTDQEAAPAKPDQTAVFEGRPGPVDMRSDPDAKVAFYGRLFAGRTDVYATRWENRSMGRSGWVPAVTGGWRRHSRHENVSYLPLTPDVVAAHLRGDHQIGLYPLLPDGTCHWVAADFDGKAAVLDALAYLKAARAEGVAACLEVSNSGLGAHVWIFFTSAVPAGTARAMATGFLREASTIRGDFDLRSYDRLFPSQDVAPSGGIGNQIAAPLHGLRRQDGATVFLDLGRLEPAADQWAYLSSIARVTPRQVEQLGRRGGRTRVGADVTGLDRPNATAIHPRPPASVRVELGARITVRAADLTPPMRSTLRHAATMANPEFYERQRQRRSTWGVARFIHSFDETMDGDLVLPRALEPLVRQVVEDAGSTVKGADQRVAGDAIDVEFVGQLRPVQSRAFDALAAQELGVLQAPPGSGKSVIACAAIAEHGVSTVVLVDRTGLADQWRDHIERWLGVTPGQLGGGRTKLTGDIDIALLPTLARRHNVSDLLGGYGFVVVDECHHVPAAAFDNAIAQVPARRWLGLSATPYRRDGLDPLIHLQLGPTKCVIENPEAGTLPVESEGVAPPTPALTLHRTAFAYDGDDLDEPGAITRVHRAMREDGERTRQIVDDVVDAVRRGRRVLVLTTWVSHVESFADRLAEQDFDTVLLTGGAGARERAAARERLDAADPSRTVVVGTRSYVGEGFDWPALDTIFLASPIASKGALVQCVGRILRPLPGKDTAEIHDYVDELTPYVAASLRKRVPGYKSLGVAVPK